MILIDLAREKQTVVFYSSAFDESIFSLVITPESGTKETSFQLSTNLSAFVERSFQYELTTNLFDGLQVGLYNYSILTTNGAIATKGKLMIKGIVTIEDFIAPDFGESEDTIIFNG